MLDNNSTPSDGYNPNVESAAETANVNETVTDDGFDAEFYARTYPEVVAILGTNKDILYKHYVMYGKAEGRMGCAADAQQSVETEFDAEFYARTYPDVVAVLGTDKDVLYSHYLMFGKAEGRKASAADVK